MNIIFIFGAKYLYFLVFIIAGIYFLKQSRKIQKKIVMFSVISVIFIYLLATIGGYLYFDPRPFVTGNFTPLIPHIPDNGFPSDHVLMVSAVASIIMYFSRRVSVVLWILTTLIAISRVYVGVHHAVDVIGSVVMSLLVTSSVYTLTKYVSRKKVSK